ncbi:hypothetical protein DIE07_25830 [Burkholderia sp. Bp9002]|nr:hypothetical protein DIE07_25830 [Burkholderia sp. Bp9002]
MRRRRAHQRATLTLSDRRPGPAGRRLAGWPSGPPAPFPPAGLPYNQAFCGAADRVRPPFSFAARTE